LIIESSRIDSIKSIEEDSERTEKYSNRQDTAQDSIISKEDPREISAAQDSIMSKKDPEETY
jgi:K+/H+ antiporter YhaU regulatory subunit KhtT